MAEFYKRPKPVILIVMDGVGVAPLGPGNCVTLADTPNLDKLWPQYPHTYLEASGLNVGLPLGTDGNSEVGHMALGSGKVIYQDLPRIDNAINNGSFFQNQVFKGAFAHAKQFNSNIHIMGLISNGFVHSSIEHLFALIKMASEEHANADKVFIHMFTDGRDSAPNAAIDIIEKVEAVCIQKRIGKMASIIGRAYAMDRNRNWQKTKKTYDLLTKGIGSISKNWRKSVEDSYKANITDEYIEPICLVENNDAPITIKENDAVIFYNFRPDRAVQLTMAFEDEKFEGFQRERINNLYFAGMMEYENGFPRKMAFPPEKVLTPLGKVLSDSGLKQLRLAESEKFPHVTYFFNGTNKEIYPGETWLEIPSPKDVATYDQKPEMSQKWVTDVLIDKINSEEFDFILVNYAGPDMVAHTGVIDATIKAMNACDECIGRVVEAALNKKGAVLITADHGNAEELVDQQSGEADTKHSTNQVPFIAIKEGLTGKELPVGGLSDVAPTILKLLGLSIPADMTGRDLLS
jgi:2,3-bisphosphoglycerate-independent phosphoglycerate mutase